MTLATLAARNLTRNKTRVFLTVIGVAIAVTAFLIFRTFIFAFTVGQEQAASDRIGTRDKVSFIMRLPKNYVDKIRAVPGVRAATWADWFGGQDPRDKTIFFGAFAVDAKSYLEVYPEYILSPQAKQSFLDDRQGALVGDILAKKLHVKEGDNITLTSQIYPGEYKFHVSGVYTSTVKAVDRSSFVFHWEYLNDSLKNPAAKDKVGWILSRIDDPLRSADISKRIDATFDILDQQTTTMSEKAMATQFGGMFSAILKVISAVSLIILGIMLLILGNTIAMGVRERTHEYGTLLALGFEPPHIGRLIVLESAFVGLVGGIAGIVFGNFIVTAIPKWLEETPMSGILEFFQVLPLWTAIGLAAAVLLGAIAAFIPAWRASRLHVTSALRVVS